MFVPQLSLSLRLKTSLGRSARYALPGGIVSALLLCGSAHAAPVGTPAPRAYALLSLKAVITTPAAAPSLSEGRESVPHRAAYALPVNFGFTYRGVEIGGRKLDSSERMLQSDVTPHLSLWWAHQNILAEGRLNHKNFETSGSRYGGQVDLIGGKASAQELSGAFEIFQSGQGRANAGRDYVTYVGTRTETASLAFTQRGPRLTRQFLATASQVHGGSERATVLGGGVGLGFPLGRSLRGAVNGTLLSEHGSSGDSTHPIFDAGLTFRPVSWARLEAGAVVAPSGFAAAGTSMTGLTSFLVYKPGGAAQELAGRRAGFGVLRLVITRTF